MKALTNYRNYVLFLLFSAGLVLLLSVPTEGSSYFFITLALTKVGGIAVLAVFFKLLNRWYRAGKLGMLNKLNLLEDE